MSSHKYASWKICSLPLDLQWSTPLPGPLGEAPAQFHTFRQDPDINEIRPPAANLPQVQFNRPLRSPMWGTCMLQLRRSRSPSEHVPPPCNVLHLPLRGTPGKGLPLFVVTGTTHQPRAGRSPPKSGTRKPY